MIGRNKTVSCLYPDELRLLKELVIYILFTPEGTLGLMAVIRGYLSEEMGFLLSPFHLPDSEPVSKDGPQHIMSLGVHAFVYPPPMLNLSWPDDSL